MKESGKASGKLSMFSGKQVINSRGHSCQEKLTACAHRTCGVPRHVARSLFLGDWEGEWGRTARSNGYLGRMWAGEMIEGFICVTEEYDLSLK